VILTILLLLMFLAVTGLVVRDRLWGAMLRFLNVLFAATMATVWYEPLAALGDPFVDRIQPPFGQFFDARMFLGLAPDRKWLAWVRGSTGAAGPFASYSETGKPWFDPDADFVLRYADRRWDNLKNKDEGSGDPAPGGQ
jgi:hypothetical protein